MAVEEEVSREQARGPQLLIPAGTVAAGEGAEGQLGGLVRLLCQQQVIQLLAEGAFFAAIHHTLRMSAPIRDVNGADRDGFLPRRLVYGAKRRVGHGAPFFLYI